MVKRWRSTVKDNDTIVHLGDLFFGKGGFEDFRDNIAPELTGRKFLILGNHDKPKVDYAALGFTVIEPFEIMYQKYKVTFEHYPRYVPYPMRLHVHGHIHNNGHRDETIDTPEGKKVIVNRSTNNINVSVEVIDYRPIRVTRLLNSKIRELKGRDTKYLNKCHGKSQTRSRKTPGYRS